MNKFVIALCFACFVTSPAYATNNQNRGANHHNNNTTINHEVTNRVNNNNTNVNVSNSNSSANSVSSSRSQSEADSSSSSNSHVSGSGNSSLESSNSATGGSSSAVGGDQNVSIKGDVAASSAVAPGLVAGEDTCMGSSSGGASGKAFGISLGSTWTDKDCVRRKDARFLHNIGLPDVGLALMCEKKEVREAVIRAKNIPAMQVCNITMKEIKKYAKAEQDTRSSHPSSSNYSNLRD